MLACLVPDVVANLWNVASMEATSSVLPALIPDVVVISGSRILLASVLLCLSLMLRFPQS